MLFRRPLFRYWLAVCCTVCCAPWLPAQEVLDLKDSAAPVTFDLPTVTLGAPQSLVPTNIPSADSVKPIPQNVLPQATQLRSLPSLPVAVKTQSESQAETLPPKTDFTAPKFNPLDALPAEIVRAVPETAAQPTPQPTQQLPSLAPYSAAQTSNAAPDKQLAPPIGGGAPAINNRFDAAPNVTENRLPPQNLSPDKQNAANRDESPADKKPDGPIFYTAAGLSTPPAFDEQAWRAPYYPGLFSPAPISSTPSDPASELSPYRGKSAVPVQRPWVELWRPLYTSGIYPPAKEWFGRYNPVMPHFMVYGDYRTGIGINRNAKGDTNNWAHRLNLDMDLEITATERLHAFMGPLDRAGDFTRLDFTDRAKFEDRTDIRLDNLFFEGDAGAIFGGLTDQDAPFDLPFSFGFMPIFYQNGIWAADNVIGAAVALPAKHSPLLKWSNYDATFFWASDQINSDAFAGDNNAAEFFGTAWFIEAYDGYIEADYAFVHDDVGGHRSYHNLSVAYTRRYFYRVSNAIRYITNFGQSLPSDQRTADGHMLLIENSLISKAPNTLVPYLNFFYGQGRTQSLARAGAAGGILNNTGINFETDGLTGYPTLDATGVNATGAALGVNILGANFQHQLILEMAALSANGQSQFRNAPGDEYAVGMRYQKPLSNAWLFRTDHMLGWRENARDLRGSRVELRWKF